MLKIITYGSSSVKLSQGLGLAISIDVAIVVINSRIKKTKYLKKAAL